MLYLGQVVVDARVLGVIKALRTLEEGAVTLGFLGEGYGVLGLFLSSEFPSPYIGDSVGIEAQVAS